MYGYERGTARYDTNRPLYWDGYVGLMYPSDYGYAAGNSCVNGTELGVYYEVCSDKDWLYISNTNQWLMLPNSGYSSDVFTVHSIGFVHNREYKGNSRHTLAVSPVFFLNSSASISSGDGTLDAPYILS